MVDIRHIAAVAQGKMHLLEQKSGADAGSNPARGISSFRSPESRKSGGVRPRWTHQKENEMSNRANRARDVATLMPATKEPASGGEVVTHPMGEDGSGPTIGTTGEPASSGDVFSSGASHELISGCDACPFLSDWRDWRCTADGGPQLVSNVPSYIHEDCPLAGKVLAWPKMNHARPDEYRHSRTREGP